VLLSLKKLHDVGKSDAALEVINELLEEADKDKNKTREA
jgi:hypothetical protein